MENVVVFSSIAIAVVFVAAWMLRPDLRAWIEKPKYRFQRNVQSYDHIRAAAPVRKEGKSA